MKRLIVGLILGLVFLTPGLLQAEEAAPAAAPAAEEAVVAPQYKCVHCDMVFEKAGKCPHCGTELNVVVADAEATKVVAEAAK